MSKLLTLLALALASAACQPQVTQTTAATTTPTPAAVVAQPASPAALADSLTPAMRTTLRQVNLASLFLAPEAGQNGVLDGFFGRDPQRLSLAILQATRDSLNPELFHLIGKTRYQKQVSSFAGTLQISRIEDFHDQARLLSQGEDSFIQDTTTAGEGAILNAHAYSAVASFRFASRPPGTYALEGRAMLDFWITDKGKAGGLYASCEGCPDDQAPSKGSELLLQGKRLNYKDKSERGFLVCRDVFFIANGLIPNFGIGDRGAQVNPKYAKLGWRTYWENDEWWADSPKPSLSL
jgi:hypothetical protein